MKPDVTINGVSLLSLGWLRETVNFPTPQSQSNTITVPGRNSPIRFTEALGRVAYQPRSFDMTFSMLGNRADFDCLVSTVVNQFAGQLCRVTLTEDPTLYAEDPTLYAIGTLEADPTYDPLTGKGQLVLSSTDGDAFLYYVSETVESISGSGTLTLHNDYMPVVPVITTTAETTLRWTVDGESFHKTVSTGTWEIPELELRYDKRGNNDLHLQAGAVIKHLPKAYDLWYTPSRQLGSLGDGTMWFWLALGSAVFAALTSILAKIGIEGVGSNLATAIRTMVVVVMAWGMVFITHQQEGLNTISQKSWLFLILSGLATGASWLCYYKALQMGEASRVVPIDKLSVVITLVLAFVFLHEQFTTKSLIGCILIGAGTLLLVL